jgi:hypothetical protein
MSRFHATLLGVLLSSACSSFTVSGEDSDLAGLYAGTCAAGEGRLDLREDGTFLLSLVAAEGGTRWTLTGRRFDGGSTREDSAEGDLAEFNGVLRIFAFQGEYWRLQWSTGPALTRADWWSPPMWDSPYSPLHVVSERGVVLLNAFDGFILRRTQRSTSEPSGVAASRDGADSQPCVDGGPRKPPSADRKRTASPYKAPKRHSIPLLTMMLSGFCQGANAYDCR